VVITLIWFVGIGPFLLVHRINWQPMTQKELIGGAETEHDERVSV
jgi:hypothetical protein